MRRKFYQVAFAKTTKESECLVAMFLLGLAVPAVAIQKSIGQDAIDLFQRLGLAFPCQTDPSLIVPYLHIFPLTMGDANKSSKTLWLLTDLHPRVLSTTTVGTKKDGAVMYIGPDSLALVQHFITSISELPSKPTVCLDVCTGSGVQALAALATMESIQSATVLDINPRALRFAHFNAVLNGLDDRLHQYILGDLVSGQGKRWQPNQMTVATDPSPLLVLLTPALSYQEARHHLLVLANPPFLPVPSYDTEIRQRYGLFSDGGGPSGERVLQAIVEISAAMTNQASINTTTALVDVGIVSEFVNPPIDGADDDNGADSNSLLHRLKTWWQSPCDSCTQGILFTNEFPVEATTYAQRRADDGREAIRWLQHLEQQGITHLSPGLLYIRARRPAINDVTSGQPPGSAMQLQHVLVPKTRAGSIWTPNNQEAVAFVHGRARAFWRTSPEPL